MPWYSLIHSLKSSLSGDDEKVRAEIRHANQFDGNCCAIAGVSFSFYFICRKEKTLLSSCCPSVHLFSKEDYEQNSRKLKSQLNCCCRKSASITHLWQCFEFFSNEGLKRMKKAFHYFTSMLLSSLFFMLLRA